MDLLFLNIQTEVSAISVTLKWDLQCTLIAYWYSKHWHINFCLQWAQKTFKLENKVYKILRKENEHKKNLLSPIILDIMILNYPFFRVLSKKSLLLIILCVQSDQTILWKGDQGSTVVNGNTA